MAKNTGTGTRSGGLKHSQPYRSCPICADPATRPPFAKARHEGGAFKGVRRSDRPAGLIDRVARWLG